MNEPCSSPARCRSGHPDQVWIARLRSALAHWEQTGSVMPTSTVLGGGAVAAAEAAFSELHDGRPTLLLPSATYAIRAGLHALGVAAGDEVICPVIDWPAALAAIASLGATPVPVAVDPQTITIDPVAAARARTSRTRAVIACHLHGICADIPTLRERLPGISICEDASQAFAARLDGHRAATFGDVAVLSLGPGKHIDAGEGGVLLFRTVSLHHRAIAAACHPLRNLLAGTTTTTDPRALVMRPHPVTAVLALHELAHWSPAAAQESRSATLARLASQPRVIILGHQARHASTQPYVPLLITQSRDLPPLGLTWARSGAQVLPGSTSETRRAAQALLRRIRLATALPVSNSEAPRPSPAQAS
jgi:dTDP-4-amino-4,6-dideoxygalactose transaminase